MSDQPKLHLLKSGFVLLTELKRGKMFRQPSKLYSSHPGIRLCSLAWAARTDDPSVHTLVYVPVWLVLIWRLPSKHTKHCQSSASSRSKSSE